MGAAKRYLKRFEDSLWFRPANYALLALLGVALCWLVQEVGLPVEVDEVSSEMVSRLLSIITTSMLTVTTFAIGAMVTAFASASGAGTPRAFKLIIADGTSQNAASSFIGAFIFGVVATVGLESGTFYSDDGLLALAVMTVGILVWVIGTFIVWIDNIARLGQVDTSIKKAEQAAADALARVTTSPYLGGARRTNGDTNRSAVDVFPHEFGYLTSVDMELLQLVAEQADATIVLSARPGALIDPSLPIAQIDGPNIDADGEAVTRVSKAFKVSDERSFMSDPEFSLRVLGEIGAKALSPGVNDPGTALTVMNAVTRQIADWQGRDYDIDEPEYPRVFVPAIETHRLVRAGFDLVARYGASDADVIRHLMASFRYLANAAGEPSDAEIAQYARTALGEAKQVLSSRDFTEIAGQCPSGWTDDL